MFAEALGNLKGICCSPACPIQSHHPALGHWLDPGGEADGTNWHWGVADHCFCGPFSIHAGHLSKKKVLKVLSPVDICVCVERRTRREVQATGKVQDSSRPSRGAQSEWEKQCYGSYGQNIVTIKLNHSPGSCIAGRDIRISFLWNHSRLCCSTGKIPTRKNERFPAVRPEKCLRNYLGWSTEMLLLRDRKISPVSLQQVLVCSNLTLQTPCSVIQPSLSVWFRQHLISVQ